MGYADAEQRRAYQREWLQRRRDEWIASMGGRCAWCSSTRRLEVDHIDPDLKVSHSVWSWSLARRMAELKKCQVLCHDCHLVKSDAAQQRAGHGSKSMYSKHGCRCDVCRTSNTERKKIWRAQQA